jgi:hypothetical protein
LKCILCEAWASSPANPKSMRPAVPTDVHVETSLVLGFMWGTLAPDAICEEHALMIADIRRRLTHDPEMIVLERRARDRKSFVGRLKHLFGGT